MKTRTRLTSTLVLLPLALGGLAAASDDCRTVDPDETVAGDEYELCTLRTYFHAADTKASNLGTVEGSPHGLPSWDAEAPTTSVSGGGGAGFLSNSIVTQGPGGDQGRAVFEGTFDGIVDVLDVDLHLMGPVPTTAAVYNVTLEIDGIPYAEAQELEIVAAEEPNATGAAKRLDFAITGLAEILIDDFGATEASALTYRLEVEPTYIVNDTALFVFDTTEVPGGITFNPASLPAGLPTIAAF